MVYIFIRTLSETSNVVNVPWALKEIEGGSLNAKKPVDHIIATIISIHPLPPHSNAFHDILSLVAPGTEGHNIQNGGPLPHKVQAEHYIIIE